jgi:hypothetical protein
MAVAITPEKVTALFRQLLGRDVTGAKIPPFIIPVADPCITATFVAEDGAMVAVCVCDLDLAANAGAALVLIPAGAAKDCVTTRKLDPSLRENFLEILNICSSLFGGTDTQRVKLGKVCDSQKERSEDVVKFIKTPHATQPVKLTIAGYGAGRICVYT